MRVSSQLVIAGIVVGLVVVSAVAPSVGQEPNVDAVIRGRTDALVKAFNSGKAADVAAQFAPEGEMIDEEGNLFAGRKELTEAMTQFFTRFPKAQLEIKVESVRSPAPGLVIEEGTRQITAGEKEQQSTAVLRYSAIHTKVDGKWQIASLREFTADPIPSHHEQLKTLEWLVGDWVNEGTDAVVRISYRWSEDKHYLLGDYQVSAEGKPVMKSTQRIGWNPLTGSIRSWLFDSDGGFSEGNWAATEEGWVIKSTSVNPDASTGSATVTLTAKDKSRFTIKGTERIVAGQREPDFEVSVARRPPSAKP